MEKRFQHNFENFRYNFSFQTNTKNFSTFVTSFGKWFATKVKEFSETSRDQTVKILSAMFDVNSEVKFASKTANGSRTEEQ